MHYKTSVTVDAPTTWCSRLFALLPSRYLPEAEDGYALNWRQKGECEPANLLPPPHCHIIVAADEYGSSNIVDLQTQSLLPVRQQHLDTPLPSHYDGDSQWKLLKKGAFFISATMATELEWISGIGREPGRLRTAAVPNRSYW